MPSSKAILRDIAEHGLDPSVPHARVALDGRLARRGLQHVVPAIDESLVEPAETPSVDVAEVAVTVVEEQPSVEADVPAPTDQDEQSVPGDVKKQARSRRAPPAAG